MTPENMLTIAAVAVSCGANIEFTDLAGLEQMFSIKHALAYKLMTEGVIRSVTLRRRGQIKGKRLIDVASVRKFLASRPERVSAKLAAQTRKANKLAIESRRQNKAMAEAAQ
jgi:hypothetical protein